MAELSESSLPPPTERPSALIADIPDRGRAFWNHLNPEEQATFEGPIRKIEQFIAERFPEGYSSPLLPKAVEMSKKGELVQQMDERSCTVVAFANALRILDKPRNEYTVRRISALAGVDSNLGSEEYKRVLSSRQPYSSFRYKEIKNNATHSSESCPEMAELFQALQAGNVVSAGWNMYPGDHIHVIGKLTTTVGHERTLIGFTIGKNKEISLMYIDPYEAKTGRISFRDWIIASWLGSYLSDKSRTDPDIQEVVQKKLMDGSFVAEVATNVSVIQKNSTPTSNIPSVVSKLVISNEPPEKPGLVISSEPKRPRIIIQGSPKPKLVIK